MDKVVELVGGGSFINRPIPSSLCTFTSLAIYHSQNNEMKILFKERTLLHVSHSCFNAPSLLLILLLLN